MIVLIFAGLGIIPALSQGQEKGGKKVKPPANIISMDVLEVKGKIPKPQWFMILSRGDLLYKEI
ncbi:MAG: hypothetical protein FJ088_14245, partial [Deltaproteobacteria bacterium]|nr:hypothetical protein [Deltaproteobacteria bacterium]